MRYETVTTSPLLLPEKTATVQNVDTRTAVIVQVLMKTQTRQITLYPGQKINFVNASVYVRTAKNMPTARVGIYPLGVSQGEVSGETITLGADGKSAYELAQENGFVGTLSEWLASLKSADGEKGDKGDAGFSPMVQITDNSGSHTVSITDVTGTQSFIVADGDKGDKGDKGDPGDKGNDGFSPSIVVTDNGDDTKTITVTTESSSQSFTVMDAASVQNLTEAQIKALFPA